MTQAQTNRSAQNEIELRLPYKLTGWQQKVKRALDKHQFVVVAAGARSGKTVLAEQLLIAKAAKKANSVNWYVAPTFGMAKNIAWSELKNMLDPFWSYGLVHKVNDSELLINFCNNSVIQLKTGENPDSLRGVGLDFLIMDEFATMKAEVWSEVLRPRVIDKKGQALFIGTPAGYNHFYELYQMELKEKHWKSFHFKTTDNPYIDQSEIEKARRDMDERAFKQEFEASFMIFGGQVFSSFDRNKHATDKIVFSVHHELCCGMDFGWAAPSPVLFIAVDLTDNVFVIDEIMARETPIPEIGKQIREKALKYEHWYKPSLEGETRFKGIWRKRAFFIKEPDVIYCDPAGASKTESVGTSSVLELEKLGFEVKYRNNYPGIIQDGIVLIRKWINNNKFFIHPRCVNLIKAMEMYHYPERQRGVQSEVPVKDGISDHWIDALRYFFLNRFERPTSVWRA